MEIPLHEKMFSILRGLLMWYRISWYCTLLMWQVMSQWGVYPVICFRLEMRCSHVIIMYIFCRIFGHHGLYLSKFQCNGEFNYPVSFKVTGLDSPPDELNTFRGLSKQKQKVDDTFSNAVSWRNFLYFNSNFVLDGPVDIHSLVWLMAWHWMGTSHYLNQWWPSSLIYICIPRPLPSLLFSA